MEQQKSSNPMSSFLPILIFGMAAMFLLQYFDESGKKTDSSGSSAQQAVQEPGQNQADSPAPGQEKEPTASHTGGPADFSFPVAEQENLYEIRTGNYIVRLSDKGGKVHSLYVVNNDHFSIPDLAIEEVEDAFGKENKSFEITRGNGMDFQPHLYFRDSLTGRIDQAGNPVLNKGAFQVSGPVKNQETGLSEIRFTLPVTFKGHKLELIKVYRFLESEYYFRQITVLRNLEKTDFILNGDLFFKSFGDVGPSPEGMNKLFMASYGRFYYYNDSLSHWSSLAYQDGSMSCYMPGCGGKSSDPYSIFLEKPDGLEFIGSTSRYFMAYNRFGAPPGASHHRPDGLIMINRNDPAGKENATAVYRDLRLGAAREESLDLGGVDPAAEDNFTKVSKAQTRNDALIVDSRVYYGIRRDESHMFQNTAAALKEFGTSEPEYKARDTIYSSGFLAFFGPVRDGVVHLMRFLYQYIGNYGWVIIIIAVSFKLATWPLNQMQAKSMRTMTALKPEIEKINEQYKDNPETKQKKIMELYKEHKVNPAKGCLPVLIQIPVFIALYSAFSESIELWKSPFIFWMTDLSAPDTLFVIPDLIIMKNVNVNILPLVMVGTQLLQQMTTTVVTDNNQKMIMYMMPVIMLVFFWNMPSGVTLYWSIQNFITIIWQVVPQHFSKDK